MSSLLNIVGKPSDYICNSALAGFLYPGYASYKTLSQRPASEVDLERWLMYWSVLGCVVGVEYVAEWLVSWYVISFDQKKQSFTLGYTQN